MNRGELAFTNNREVFVPDVKHLTIKPGHVYVPLRGYSANLGVFIGLDRCIGWIDTRVLGYENAKTWMTAVKWQDKGH